MTVDIKKYALSQFRSFDVKLLRRVLDISIFTMLQYFISLSTYFMLFVAVEHLGQRELAVANIVRSVYIVLLIPVNSLSTTILSVYTNDVTLIQASIPSLYVISGALLIGAVANIVFNGVTGTGNTRSAFVMELATLVFYTLFIYVVGMRLHMPVAICFMTEVVYYTGLLVASVIYLKKASWQNKKI